MSEHHLQKLEEIIELEEKRIEANEGIWGARLMLGVPSGWLWWKYFEYHEPGDGFRLGVTVLCTVVFLTYEGFSWGVDRYYRRKIRATQDRSADS